MVYMKSVTVWELQNIVILLVAAGSLLTFTGCSGNSSDPRFNEISPSHSGISFTNRVEQTPEFNIINYLYFYDGGGVAIGDINGDGLPDIYLTANMGDNRLYLNEGDFKFRDITARAGVEGRGEWTTGTTMVDINGDGLLDIYVCNVHYRTKKGRNELYINNGDSTFTEKAEEYGLAFRGYSKQSAYFDMDRDGDLDMFLVNHSVHNKDTFQPRSQQNVHSPDAGDRLFLNEGGTFRDVTEEAGIHSTSLGYGLDVAVGDLNGDNYPDIYIANDFHENDYLYLNQQDGTFRDVLPQSAGHTSRASMGSDIADINNDLKPDIAVVDMLPYSEEGLKTTISSEPHQLYSVQREYGYHPQLIRNSLQLNLGKGSNSVPLLADIAPMAGVHASDWSWSALLFDMDNDGLKDFFVSNGIFRRPNNMDYLSIVRREDIQRSLKRGMTKENMSVIDSMPQLKIPNRAYRNDGGLRFSVMTEEWGLNKPAYSNGAAYGDLDNDGDLDIVVNNVNSEATIYRNMTTEKDSSSYLTVKLKGTGKNKSAIGAKVTAHADGVQQVLELFPSRGFQSSVDPRLFFGLGKADRVDSLSIVWPSGPRTLLADVAVNQQLTIEEQQVEKEEENKMTKKQPSALEEVASPLHPAFQHSENDYNEFETQPFMPYSLSRMGPPIAVADVNGDGKDDLFIGGAAEQGAAVFLQDKEGKFSKKENRIFEEHGFAEDTDAVFFDADNDGNPDLYVVSGGNEGSGDEGKMYDRLYLNDGAGNFVSNPDGLPDFSANGSVVVPIDFNGDGRKDLFVGSRSEPGSYGKIPLSYLLQNQGDGSFIDVTESVGPGLRRMGMVSDAQAADLTGDGREELIVAGDWMPVSVFQIRSGKFEKISSFESPDGLWQSLHLADIDSDGDIDILAGNMGLNTPFNVSEEEPLVMYTADFSGRGNVDPIIGYTKNSTVYPVAPRDRLLASISVLRKQFPTYESYANKSLADIFGEQQLRNIPRRDVAYLASVYFVNKGNGNFEMIQLPVEMQTSPIFAFHSKDMDRDGTLDIVAGGNLHDVLPVYGGRYDASYGWYLEGSSGSRFKNAPVSLMIQGEMRDIESVSTGKNDLWIVIGVNDKAPVFLKPSMD